ncbi:MAG: DUF4336 domain-containing protein [Hyphomonadaceae bacterium]|nr:DUF4336 domain-containing protein [Hyphomonadaceae bacterium]
MLEPFGENIWIAAGGEASVAGFRYPTRMAVLRLADGGIFAWSPIALTDALKSHIDALGPVRFIVTPTALHDLALPAWRAAYPEAVLYAAPGSRARCKTVSFDSDLGEDAPSAWGGQIDQVPVRGNAIATEIVFFHRASGTALFADLLQNFPPGWFRGWRGVVARLDGMVGVEARVPQKFRVAFTDRRAARESLARIFAWPVQNVIMAHGDPVRGDGAAYLRRAFAWLGEKL